MEDGSQYDRSFPWEQDCLLEQLGESLTALAAAATLTEQATWRAVAASHRHDLLMLHGIDLHG